MEQKSFVRLRGMFFSFVSGGDSVVSSKNILVFSVTVMACASVAVATEIAPYKAREIQPYQAKEIKPYAAREPAAKNTTVSSDGTRQATHAGNSAAAPGGVNSLIGVYSTNVGGGTYITPGNTPGYGVLHTSAGAKSGALTLRGDHTYTWNAYGGKQGRWQETGRSDYPIVLDDRAEKKRWLLGPKRGDADRVVIWDGNAFNYVGKRVQ